MYRAEPKEEARCAHDFPDDWTWFAAIFLQGYENNGNDARRELRS